MVKKALVLIVLITQMIGLAACQPLSGLVGLGKAAQSPPTPLTGARASILGSSALLLEQNFGGSVHLVPIEAATGKPTPGFDPIDFGDSLNYALSADDEQLAFVTNLAAVCPGLCLRLLNLRTWKETLEPVSLTQSSLTWLGDMSFNPQGNRLVVALNDPTEPKSQVIVVDLQLGKVIGKANLDSIIQKAAMMADGSIGLVGNVVDPAGQNGLLRVVVLDGNSLNKVWDQQIQEISYGGETPENLMDPSQGRYLFPAEAFSSDHRQIFAVAADADKLVTIDLVHRSVASTAVEPKKGWLEQLWASTAEIAYAKMLNGATKQGLLSGDGRTFYVSGQTSTAVKDKDGNWNQVMTSLGLEAIDLGTGRQIAKVDLPAQATPTAVSPDGKLLFIASWESDATSQGQWWTDIVDTQSFQVLQHLKGEYTPSRLLDGSLAWLSANPVTDRSYEADIYEPDGQPLRSSVSLTEIEFAEWIALP